MSSSPRFESIHTELEEVRQNFHRLLSSIPDDILERKIPGEGWTIKQEMFHIVQALEILPKGIKRAVVGGGWSFLAFIPTGVRSWVNGAILIPAASRQATRHSIAEAFDQAYDTLIELLAGLPEEAWDQGAAYPRQYRTVEQMAHRPFEHFEEHAAHVTRLLGIERKGLPNETEDYRRYL